MDISFVCVMDISAFRCFTPNISCFIQPLKISLQQSSEIGYAIFFNDTFLFIEILGLQKNGEGKHRKFSCIHCQFLLLLASCISVVCLLQWTSLCDTCNFKVQSLPQGSFLCWHSMGFDKCRLTFIRHYGIIRKSFTVLKIPRLHLATSPPVDFLKLRDSPDFQACLAGCSHLPMK